jgi:hypothetical protein
MYHQAGDKNESMDRWCGDILGDIGLRLEGAEVSEDGPERRQQVAATLVALAQAVYTCVQMLEIHPKNCHFRHFSGSSARLPGGTARSARHCSIMGSDTTARGRTIQKPSAHRCTKRAISNSADCSLSRMAHNDTRRVPVGVTDDAPLRLRLGCGSLSTQHFALSTLNWNGSPDHAATRCRP